MGIHITVCVCHGVIRLLYNIDNLFTSVVLQSADGLSCEQIMNTGGTVTVLCIDNLHGLIVAAVKNTIKYVDPRK